MKRLSLFTIVLLCLLLPTQGVADTLQQVRKRGALHCGIASGVPGYSIADKNGNWVGFAVDLCRAISAAVFGNADKVRYMPLSAKNRFEALLSGQIDVLTRTTTWTMQRDTVLGAKFAGVSYYDGQGFMTKANLGLTKSVAELDGAAICVQGATTTERNLADYFETRGLSYTPIPLETNEKAAKMFETGRCQAFTANISQLYGLRSRMSDPSSAVVLPEIISKEPMSPAIRQGDEQWFSIVKWSLQTMINAEEMGINSLNADEMIANGSPAVKRLLGVGGPQGAALGLADDWTYQIIKQVGNYGELFERNLGKQSSLKIERGLNALWTQGGLMYGIPMR